MTKEVHELPLLDDLLDAGVDVDSVWDLVNTTESYPEIIPTLVMWLYKVDQRIEQPYREKVLEGVLRSLMCKEAKGIGAKPIADLMLSRRQSSGGLQWVMGAALASVSDPSVYEELVQIIRDKSFGKARKTSLDRNVSS